MATSSMYKWTLEINKHSWSMNIPCRDCLHSSEAKVFPTRVMQVPEITVGLERGGATWSVGHTSLGGNTSVKVWGGMLAGTSRSTGIKGLEVRLKRSGPGDEGSGGETAEGKDADGWWRRFTSQHSWIGFCPYSLFQLKTQSIASTFALELVTEAVGTTEK